MSVIAVVFQSGGGHTKVLTECIAKGAASVPGVEVKLLEIKGEHIAKGRWDHPETLRPLDGAHAIVFGCATYLGSASSIFKAFLEKAFDVWRVQGWKDKTAAGFTNSASQSGDKGSTLIQLAIFAAQMGMIWNAERRRVPKPPGTTGRSWVW